MGLRWRRKLIVFWQPGCEYCKEVLRMLPAFADRHPEIEVLRWDATTRKGWTDVVRPPESIPSFLLLTPGMAPKTLEGDTILAKLDRMLTLTELEAWVAR